MSKMTLEQSLALQDTLAQHEFFWTFLGRVQLLREAGLDWLIPHVNLEGSPKEVAFRLARSLDGRSADSYDAITRALAAHPNPKETR